MIKHIIGGTFSKKCTYTINGVAQNIGLVDIKSQIRDLDGNLIAELAINKFSPLTGEYYAEVVNTTAWKAGGAHWDIVYTTNGRPAPTDRIELELVESITKL